MKFWKRLQFVLCLTAYLCVLVLVIKNIAIGTIGIMEFHSPLHSFLSWER